MAASEELEKREGEIYVKSGDKVETVKVYQTGGPVLLLSKNEYAVASSGETITVDVQSNFDYEVQMPDVDWIINEPATRGMSSHTLKYIVTPNESHDSRSAEIIFRDKNSTLKETLKITQAQKDAIILSQKVYIISADGGNVEVKLNVNIDFEVKVPDVDWIHKVSTRSLTEYNVCFSIDKNESTEKRTAKIVFVNNDGLVSDTLTITQEAALVGGTLKERLGDQMLTITSLKVDYALNGDDICYLRKMLGGHEFNEADRGKLEHLDLSEATIIKGGDYYYYHESLNGYLYTIANTIAAYTFTKCNNLKSIILPDNVLAIGPNVFNGCPNLSEITIGEKTQVIAYEVFQNIR